MQDDLADAIGAQEEEILRAIAKASETGTDSEEPVKFGVTLRGVLNLDANTVETAFSFTTRTSVKEKHPLEDPKQGKLPLDATSITISRLGPDGERINSVTVTPGSLEKMKQKVEATLADVGFLKAEDGVYRREPAQEDVEKIDAALAACMRKGENEASAKDDGEAAR